MGVKKTFFLSLPDNKLDTLPLLEIIQKIENFVLHINHRTDRISQKSSYHNF